MQSMTLRAAADAERCLIIAGGVDSGVNAAAGRNLVRLFTGQGCLHLFKRVEIFL